MECPNCGTQLPHLAQLLAQTETGTNCPRCWARVRRLAPPRARVRALKAVKKGRHAPALRRAA